MGWIGSPGGRGYRAPYGANNVLWSAIKILRVRTKAMMEERKISQTILPQIGAPIEIFFICKVQHLA